MRSVWDLFRGDQIIWAVVLILSFISLLAVYSSTGTLVYRMDKNAHHFLVKQLLVLAMGLGIIFLVHRIHYTRFARMAVLLYVISIPLLIYTLVFGTSINDGTRWVRLPLINLTFQTSDLAKLALFMLLARMLSTRQATIKDWKKGFIPVLIPVLLTCLFIMPANLSTAMMLGVSCCILFFIGRVRVKHILVLALGGLILLTGVYTVSKITGLGRAETWESRFADFLSSFSGEGTEVYQVLQAKIAIANGGLTGLGPGNSMQKNLLPEAFSDFIFASIIEEYGLLGAALLVSLYLLLLWRSIVLFRRCPYAFGAFLAVGLTITLVFQAMINMAVNVNLLPVTGLTLPLVSMGGSSVLFTSIALGMVLSVSRYVEEMEGQGKTDYPLSRSKAGGERAKEKEVSYG